MHANEFISFKEAQQTMKTMTPQYRRGKMCKAIEMPDKEEFSELYLSHVTIPELAEKYFVSDRVVNRWAKSFGLSKIRKYLKKEDIQKVFNRGTTYTEMARQLDCSTPTLTTYLKKYNFITEGFVKRIKLDMNEVYELRVNSRWTFMELAELYETNDATIRDRCKKHNFPKVKVEQEARTWRRIGGKL